MAATLTALGDSINSVMQKRMEKASERLQVFYLCGTVCRQRHQNYIKKAIGVVPHKGPLIVLCYRDSNLT